MTKKVHITIQSVLQALQVFVSFPGLSLAPETQTTIHAAIAAVTVMLAGFSQHYNTDGTVQEVAFKKPEGIINRGKGGGGK